MSLKSRQRAYQNACKQERFSNPLPLQKQAVQGAVLKHLGATVMFLIFALISVIIGFSSGAYWNAGVFGAGCIVWGVSACYGISLIRRITIFRRLNKISVSTEQTVTIQCEKITFLCQPIAKHSSVILCTVLKDGGGNKFYYVYPQGDAPSDFAKRYIKERYLGAELQLICYKNTPMVKILPSQKDPQNEMDRESERRYPQSPSTPHW